MRRLVAALGISLASVTGAFAGGQVQSSLGTTTSSFTLCSGPCAVMDVNVIDTTPAVFVFVFDAASLPGNGVVGASAKVAYPVAIGQMGSYVWGAANPAIFLNGAVIACSSTVPPTFTASATCQFFGRAN